MWHVACGMWHVAQTRNQAGLDRQTGSLFSFTCRYTVMSRYPSHPCTRLSERKHNIT
eukprot:jgi/Mesvir1/1448/Mv25483-RA.1